MPGRSPLDMACALRAHGIAPWGIWPRVACVGPVDRNENGYDVTSLRCIVKGRQINCHLLLWRLGTKGVSVCGVASACGVMISCFEIDTFLYRKTKPNTACPGVERHRHRGPCPAPHYAPTPRGRQRRRAGDSTPRPRGGGQAERTRETLVERRVVRRSLARSQCRTATRVETHRTL